MADNRNVSLAPSLSPKDVVATRRTTPAITLASGMPCFFGAKKWLFLAIFALGQAKRVKNTHARCVKNTQAKRLAKHKKTANLTVGGLLICDRLAYSPLSSATNTAR